MRRPRVFWEIITLFEDATAEDYALLATEADGSIRLASPKSVAVVPPLERKFQVAFDEIWHRGGHDELSNDAINEINVLLTVIQPQTLSILQEAQTPDD